MLVGCEDQVNTPIPNMWQGPVRLVHLESFTRPSHPHTSTHPHFTPHSLPLTCWSKLQHHYCIFVAVGRTAATNTQMKPSYKELLVAGSLFCRASVARNLQDVSDVGHYVWSLGCWTDDKENRVLSEASLMGNLEMTTENCATECIGSVYFGTEYGGECFCGASTDNPAEFGGSTACTMPCTGDSSQICGGRNAINVFKFTDYIGEGCFVDDTETPVLSAAAYEEVGMTTDRCAELCDEYPVFGTESGTKCFCGLSTDVPDELGDSSGCTIACPGAPAETCGGLNAISVFSFYADS